jgi:hypothetical protein
VFSVIGALTQARSDRETSWTLICSRSSQKLDLVWYDGLLLGPPWLLVDRIGLPLMHAELTRQVRWPQIHSLFRYN